MSRSRSKSPSRRSNQPATFTPPSSANSFLSYKPSSGSSALYGGTPSPPLWSSESSPSWDSMREFVSYQPSAQPATFVPPKVVSLSNLSTTERVMFPAGTQFSPTMFLPKTPVLVELSPLKSPRSSPRLSSPRLL